MVHGAVIIIIVTLVSALCLPLPSLHPFDFYEIFLLLVNSLMIRSISGWFKILIDTSSNSETALLQW